MTSTAADTFAVHAALGRAATDRRFARWVAAEGEPVTPGDPPCHRALHWLEAHRMGPAMRRELLHPAGTATDVVRAVIQRARFSRRKLDACRAVFDETGTPYPVEVEAMLGELTEQFNAINEDKGLADIRLRIVAACKTPEQGAALADELDRAIELVRTKDRIAANIALLAEAFDAALAAEERRHGRLHEWAAADEELMWAAMRAWAAGQLEAHLATLAPDVCARLAAMVDAARDDPLGPTLAAYFAEAERTREIAEAI